MPVQIHEQLPVGEVGGEPVRDVDGERGLADPGHPVDGHRTAEAEGVEQTADLGFPAGEIRDVVREEAPCLAVFGLVAEDPLVEFAEFRPGVDPEFLHQPGPCLPVDVERAGLPALLVQRAHEQPGERLPERVFGDQRRQFRDGVLPGRDLLVEAALHNGQTALVELFGLAAQRRTVHTGQGGAVPARECFP